MVFGFVDFDDWAFAILDDALVLKLFLNFERSIDFLGLFFFWLRCFSW